MRFRFLVTLIVLTVFPKFVLSQRLMTREHYIETYRKLAIEEMQRTGVPASITLAQGCLESSNGNSQLSQESNNHFGIKCKSYWRGRRTYYDDDRKHECFRHYRSVEDSYKDHSNFLTANPRYASLFLLDITDYKGWARGLKKAGYATNPQYANMLIHIIEEYKLYFYDQVLNNRELTRIDQIRQNTLNQNLSNPYSTRRVTRRNGLKSTIIKPGDSFRSLSKEFNLKPWELLKYNDFTIGKRLKVNEIIYLQRKKRKANRQNKTHILQTDESMHYISQRYGIRLSRLYKLNRLKPGQRPANGSVIYLRRKKPHHR